MKGFIIAILISSMFGCRAKAVTVDSSFMVARHADSTASLVSVKAYNLERIKEETTIVMRPDSTGTLRVVAKDTYVVVERASEGSTEKDTAKVESVAVDTAKEITKIEEKKSQDSRFGKFAVLGAAFILFCILTFLLINYITRKWK